MIFVKKKKTASYEKKLLLRLKKSKKKDKTQVNLLKLKDTKKNFMYSFK